MKVTYEACFQKSTRLFVLCIAFPGPGNIYKPAIAFWSMQARQAQAVQFSFAFANMTSLL